MSFVPPAHSGFTFTKTTRSKPIAELQPSAQNLPSPFVAVVTGASRGIGAATAKSLAQAGATGLIITARTRATLDDTEKSL